LFYPQILNEDETLAQAINGRNLSRYGDGELRLMLGGSAASQKPDSRLAKELAQVLSDPDPRVLPCIPRAWCGSPKDGNWEKYAIPKVTNHYKLPVYGSAFITRPDSAPWIDRKDYWARVRSLWAGRDVTLVIGSQRSLTVEAMPESRSVRLLEGKYRDSYEIIDQLMEWIGRPSHTVLLCLGPSATVLAWRLAKINVHAVDIGHIGMMLRHACTGRWDVKKKEAGSLQPPILA
jgi:Glycosyltransferase GT-D fold